MGLVELVRRWRAAGLLALVAVAVGAVTSAVLAAGRLGSYPGIPLQMILAAVGLASAPVFAYALREGRRRVLWYLWWIPPVVALVSAPLVGALGELVVSGYGPATQSLLLLGLLWIAMVGVPLWWLLVYLPWEFFVRGVRSIRSVGIGTAATHFFWGSVLATITLGGLLSYGLYGDPVLAPGGVLEVFVFLAYSYEFGPFVELILLIGVPAAALVLVVSLVVVVATRRRRGSLGDAFVAAAPALRAPERAEGAEQSPEEGRPAEGGESALEWWNPVRVWQRLPGAVLLLAPTTTIVTGIALLGNGSGYLVRGVLPEWASSIVGSFDAFDWAWATILLSGVNLAHLLASGAKRAMWVLVWLFAAIAVAVGVTLTVLDPGFGALDWLGVLFVSLLGVALSCLSWIFLWVPLKIVAGSVLSALRRERTPVGDLLLPVILFSGGVAVVAGATSVDTYSSGEQQQAAIIAALLGRPGEYSVNSETLLMVARIAIVTLIVAGVVGLTTSGGRKGMGDRLNKAAGIGPKRGKPNEDGQEEPAQGEAS